MKRRSKSPERKCVVLTKDEEAKAYENYINKESEVLERNLFNTLLNTCNEDDAWSYAEKFSLEILIDRWKTFSSTRKSRYLQDSYVDYVKNNFKDVKQKLGSDVSNEDIMRTLIVEYRQKKN